MFGERERVDSFVYSTVVDNFILYSPVAKIEMNNIRKIFILHKNVKNEIELLCRQLIMVVFIKTDQNDMTSKGKTYHFYSPFDWCEKFHISKEC